MLNEKYDQNFCMRMITLVPVGKKDENRIFVERRGGGFCDPGKMW